MDRRHGREASEAKTHILWCKLTAIDYIFVFLIAIPFVYGLYRGIVRMIISALAFFFGFLFARQYSDVLVESLKSWFDIGRGGKLVAFVFCFFVVVFLFSMIGRLVRKGIKGANLGCVDRLLGACLGGVLGLGLSFGLVFLIFTYLPEPDQYLKESRLCPSIVESGTYFLLMVPPWIEKEIHEEYDHLKDLWKEEKDKGNGETDVLST